MICPVLCKSCVKVLSFFSSLSLSRFVPWHLVGVCSAQDIRSVLAETLPEIENVPKIMVHYINMVRHVHTLWAEQDLDRLDPNLPL